MAPVALAVTRAPGRFRLAACARHRSRAIAPTTAREPAYPAKALRISIASSMIAGRFASIHL